MANALLIPLLILGGIVCASCAQTEFAHYVTADLHYDQPYFTFYLTHSTFSLIFPLHLLLLYFTSPIHTSAYLASIRHVLTEQLELASPIPTTSTTYTAPWSAVLPRWSWKVSQLTALVSVPALSWFVAMQYSTPMEITSIYATSSFAAYGFSLLLLGTPLSRVTVASVALAFVGVVIISLDGIGGGGEESSTRALGDGIMMFGAIVLGLYEVVYKLALPEGHGGVSAVPTPSYSPLPISNTPPPSPPADDIAISRRSHSRPLSHHHRSASTPDIPLGPTSPTLETEAHANYLQRTTSTSLLIQPKPQHSHSHSHLHVHQHSHPVPLPQALHANFLTSCIGVATFLMLWPPILGLHWMGYEVFRWPGSNGESALRIWAGLEVVAWGGSLYNAGIMVLIGVWGPTVASVANLLAIGLVAIVDALWVGVMPDLQTFIGVGCICAGFGVLLWEGEE